MDNRGLCREHLGALREWLVADGWEILPAVQPYQVLRARHPHRGTVVFYQPRTPPRITAAAGVSALVARQFLAEYAEVEGEVLIAAGGNPDRPINGLGE